MLATLLREGKITEPAVDFVFKDQWEVHRVATDLGFRAPTCVFKSFGTRDQGSAISARDMAPEVKEPTTSKNRVRAQEDASFSHPKYEDDNETAPAVGNEGTPKPADGPKKPKKEIPRSIGDENLPEYFSIVVSSCSCSFSFKNLLSQSTFPVADLV